MATIFDEDEYTTDEDEMTEDFHDANANETETTSDHEQA
jgi:hypothetical protein